MLDEKDLQAIGQLLNVTLDQRFGDFEKKLDQRFEEQHEKIMKEVAVLMDEHFQPQFNLLAEGQKEILQRLDQMEKRLKDVEEKAEDVPVIKMVIRKHSQELAEHSMKIVGLQKAN